MGGARGKIRRSPWLSPWFSLIVAIAASIAWLAVDNFILHSSRSLTAKLVSATLSAIVAAIITLLIQLYGRLDRSVEVFQKLEGSVEDLRSLEDRLLPSLYVSPGMKTFHADLLKWREQINDHDGGRASPLEYSAWMSLTDAYFRGEQERIQSKTFMTTSDQYTSLVNDISQTLADSFNTRRRPHPNPPLLRVHITAMLPEEFYNAPQIEYTRDSSQPLFFCHRWEHYSALYGPTYRHDPRTEILRYIVVRNSDFQRPKLSAFSTIEDLQDQARLVVCGSSVRSVGNDIGKEPLAVLERLMRKSYMHPHNGGYSRRRTLELIRSIHGSDRYGYWPIADALAFRSTGAYSDWQSLLKFFVHDYHTDSASDAFYCVLDEEGWAACEQDDQLSACFEAGWTPEIALFGSRSLNHPDRSDRLFWHFGIAGLWRPFARDMKLRFLTGLETAQFCAGAIRAYGRCRVKGELLSLNAPPGEI